MPSKRSRKEVLPRGRPVRLCERNSRSSSSGRALFTNAVQSGTIANSGATMTKRSSRPERCGRALLQGQSSARGTRRARAGLSSTYHAAASKYGSSMTNEANRPCQR